MTTSEEEVLSTLRKAVREGLRSHGFIQVTAPGGYVAGLLRTTAHQQATPTHRITTTVEILDNGSKLFTAIKVDRASKTETFTVYRNEYDDMWYIINNKHQKIRIRDQRGKGTGVNKSYAYERNAKVMCDRLNKGEKPKTVVIP